MTFPSFGFPAPQTQAPKAAKRGSNGVNNLHLDRTLAATAHYGMRASVSHHAGCVLVPKLGRGRFSHWVTYVLFSASDNSDPNTNGREYVAVLPDKH